MTAVMRKNDEGLIRCESSLVWKFLDPLLYNSFFLCSVCLSGVATTERLMARALRILRSNFVSLSRGCLKGYEGARRNIGWDSIIYKMK